MTASLHVVAQGMLTTVQDLGRFGYQDLGIPVAGSLDPISLRLANAVVGNPENTGALEIRMMGPTFRVDADSVRVALVGTAQPIEILGDRAVHAEPGESVRLRRGQVFRIGMIRDTSCCYLAVEGGFDLPAPFRSQSTYIRGGIGGFEGRGLKEGDDIPLTVPDAEERAEERLGEVAKIDLPVPIRVVLGPQNDYFTDAAIETFVTSEFSITPDADRMGLRLDGPVLEHAKGYDIASDGIVTGAIQVPGTGKPIILLADHQTTGGYPKVGTVISADLPRLGRMRPGGKLRFEAVQVGEAESVRREQETRILRWIDSITPITETDKPDTARLLTTNLISGVVDATE